MSTSNSIIKRPIEDPWNSFDTLINRINSNLREGKGEINGEALDISMPNHMSNILGTEVKNIQSNCTTENLNERRLSKTTTSKPLHPEGFEMEASVQNVNQGVAHTIENTKDEDDIHIEGMSDTSEKELDLRMSDDEEGEETVTKSTNNHLRGHATQEFNALQSTSQVECDFGQYI